MREQQKAPDLGGSRGQTPSKNSIGGNGTKVKNRNLDMDTLLALEHFNTDEQTFRVKKLYIDMAGDLNAGILLGQIVYWYLPSKNTQQTKLRVRREGYLWLAKQRDEWWEEIRLTPRQFDRALARLLERGLIVKKNFRFGGLKTMHIRLHEENFLAAAREQMAAVSPNGETGLTKRGNRSHQMVKPLTESTSEITKREGEEGHADPQASPNGRNREDSPSPHASLSKDHNPSARDDVSDLIEHYWEVFKNSNKPGLKVDKSTPAKLAEAIDQHGADKLKDLLSFAANGFEPADDWWEGRAWTLSVILSQLPDIDTQLAEHKAKKAKREANRRMLKAQEDARKAEEEANDLLSKLALKSEPVTDTDLEKLGKACRASGVPHLSVNSPEELRELVEEQRQQTLQTVRTFLGRGMKVPRRWAHLVEEARKR